MNNKDHTPMLDYKLLQRQQIYNSRCVLGEKVTNNDERKI